MEQNQKTNLFGMTEQELRQLASDLGEKPFSGRQLYDLIYG